MWVRRCRGKLYSEGRHKLHSASSIMRWAGHVAHTKTEVLVGYRQTGRFESFGPRADTWGYNIKYGVKVA